MTIAHTEEISRGNINNCWSYHTWHDGHECRVDVVATNGMLYLICTTCRSIAQMEGSATRVTYVAGRVVRSEPSAQ